MTSARATCRIGAAILAGGHARRLGGRAKGLLPAGRGQSILDRLRGELMRAGLRDVILIAGDREAHASWDGPVVGDLRHGIGPLGGVEAALWEFHERSEGVAVLPCDLPAFGAEELLVLRREFLATGAGVVFGSTGLDDWHPLPAIVRTGALQSLSEEIDAGVRRVRRAWRALRGEPVWFPDDRPFFNINTPSDLARWRQGLEVAG